MNKLKNNSRGFSIIEMTLASMLVLSISAVSYRVLTSQTNKQLSSMQNQKTDTISQVALSRFKADASLIDPNWVRYGVAPIYPHQGYGLGQNFYLLSETERKSVDVVNDGVTFLRRVPKSDRLYVPAGNFNRVCQPSPIISSDIHLYNSDIRLDSISGLNVNDWMLVYQAGHYALGVISNITNQSVAAPGGSSSSNSQTSSGSTQTDAAGAWTSGGEEQETASELVNPDDKSRFISVSGGQSTNQGNGGTSVVTTSQGSIRLRALNSLEMQQTGLNSSGLSNGFVTKPGAVAASFDINGYSTQDTTDNSFCFDAPKINFQKVAPVSYYVDYLTSDGKGKATSNSYKLDSKGQQLKMLVRSEYVNGQEKREYLAPIRDLGFTYDLLDRESGIQGSVARDVGRSKDSGYLLDLNSNNPNQSHSNFLTSYQIVAMKMNIGFMSKDKNSPAEAVLQNRGVKIALDPSIQKDAYRDELEIESFLTDNLNTINPHVNSQNGEIGNEQIGKPLYLVNGDSKKNEMVVPVSTFQIRADGTMSDNSKGGLYIYKDNGCAVNASSCQPSAASVIKFDIGSGARFFPNTIVQIPLSNGGKKIVVGGVAMVRTEGEGGTVNMTRTTGLGTITLAPGETLASKLANPSPTSTCNIGGCEWHAINKDNDKADLVDTAHLATEPGDSNVLYIATVTKTADENSQAVVYKANTNGNQYQYEKFAGIRGTEQGKIVSAISDRTIRINDQSYLAVCLTKKISASCGGECIKENLPDALSDPNATIDPAKKNTLTEKGDGGRGAGSGSDDPAVTLEDTLGEIRLVKAGDGLGTSLASGVTLIRHNYRCSAINVDTNNNLIVSGRLAIQPIGYNDIKRAIEYESKDKTKNSELLHNNIMYLDEAVAVEDNQTIYADYYQVDPNTYENPNNPQFIGWLTGMSTVEFADGSFGMVDGNKFRLGPNFGSNKAGRNPLEVSNAGISKIQLAGMSDRVVATIETDPNNINNSIISATYSKRSTQLPSVYIPGTFWVNKNTPRTSPTPLPSISPGMSESSWFQLYQALLTPRDASGLNSSMPMLSETTQQTEKNCRSTKPKTCS